MKVTLLHFCFNEYTIQLANSLVNYVDLTIIQPEKLSAIFQDVIDERISVIRLQKPRVRDPRNLYTMSQVMSILRELKPNVLHVQETNDPWYDLMLLSNKMPPLVTTIHDVFRHPGDRDLIPFVEYTRRISYYRSQQLIVHSDLLKDVLIKQFRVPQHRINVLPHGELGTLFQRYTGNKVVAREPHTLLFFGRIWAYKGLKYLLSAMPLVAKYIPQVKLIIAGQGENVANLLNGLDEKHYEVFNDFIPVEAVAGLFERSTAVVLPYIESSQSGVAAIAYATQTPVIASNVGGLREMIRHEQDGLLVSPCDVPALANAIIRLLSDRGLQHRIQVAALTRCQQDLNWSNIAAQTLSIYRNAMNMKNKVEINL